MDRQIKDTSVLGIFWEVFFMTPIINSAKELNTEWDIRKSPATPEENCTQCLKKIQGNSKDTIICIICKKASHKDCAQYNICKTNCKITLELKINSAEIRNKTQIIDKRSTHHETVLQELKKSLEQGIKQKEKKIQSSLKHINKLDKQ